MKTGECYYRDEADRLWLAETFVDEDGVATSTQTYVKEIGENLFKVSVEYEKLRG
nr:hypothetical protein [uncultured Pseudogulbenkiania sp.]